MRVAIDRAEAVLRDGGQAREKLAVVAPGSTLVVGPLEPEVEAEVAKVDASVLHADPADGAPLTGFQRANFAVARTAAAALYGELDDAGPAVAADAAAVSAAADPGDAGARAAAGCPRGSRPPLTQWSGP